MGSRLKTQIEGETKHINKGELHLNSSLKVYGTSTSVNNHNSHVKPTTQKFLILKWMILS